MAKWVCSVCGYVHEGDTAPEVCPICKAPAEKFTKQDDEMARDEARHGKAFAGLLKRYFGE